MLYSRAVIGFLVVAAAGCAATPKPDRAYYRVGAQPLDVEQGIVVLPVHFEGLPGKAGQYDRAIASVLMSCGRRCVGLQTAHASLRRARLDLPELPGVLFRAASRGVADLRQVPNHRRLLAVMGSVVHMVQMAARIVGTEFRPRYLLAVGIRGLGPSEAEIDRYRYRVTAAICDMKLKQLHAATSFEARASSSWLAQDLAFVSHRLLLALSHPSGSSPKARVTRTCTARRPC